VGVLVSSYYMDYFVIWVSFFLLLLLAVVLVHH